MVKPCSKPLKANPFITYRDPNTGRWVIVKPDAKVGEALAERLKHRVGAAKDTARLRCR